MNHIVSGCGKRHLNKIGKEKEETIFIDIPSKSNVLFVTRNAEQELNSQVN
jgi:hypothetical protein